MRAAVTPPVYCRRCLSAHATRLFVTLSREPRWYCEACAAVVRGEARAAYREPRHTGHGAEPGR